VELSKPVDISSMKSAFVGPTNISPINDAHKYELYITETALKSLLRGYELDNYLW
jgi:hypothetical protein